MPGNAPHILLVDDDPDMHDIIRMILEPVGYRVTTCRTGPAGMALLQRDPPSLLLLDIMLATPSEGLEIAQKIKQDPALNQTPIIMISSVGHASGIDYAQELGTDKVPAEMFLEKPLDARKLRDAVHSLVNRNN